MSQIPSKNHKNSSSALTHLFTDYRLLMTTLALALALSGCMGIYEEGFECPPGTGTKCKSISEVNEMVNQGALPQKIHPLLSKEDCKSVPSGCTVSHENSEDNSHQHLRQIEETQLSKRDISQRVWWAPWVVRARKSETRDPEDRSTTVTAQEEGETVNHAQHSI